MIAALGGLADVERATKCEFVINLKTAKEPARNNAASKSF
jgi:hypothetical protein